MLERYYWGDMPKQSAGLLMYRLRESQVEVFLVHPGGPFWAKKDLGAWSIPKGEYAAEEDPLDAARREFTEETGCEPSGEFVPLGTIRQAGGKLVSVWAVEGECDPNQIRSNLCTIEWPPRSGRRIEIPEVDRAGWFGLDEAREKILKSQGPVIDLLIERLSGKRS
jgi:predicted NUDIX family NTP pyrophosphohydrolase